MAGLLAARCQRKSGASSRVRAECGSAAAGLVALDARVSLGSLFALHEISNDLVQQFVLAEARLWRLACR
jgi:hypothetical protein